MFSWPIICLQKSLCIAYTTHHDKPQAHHQCWCCCYRRYSSLVNPKPSHVGCVRTLKASTHPHSCSMASENSYSNFFYWNSFLFYFSLSLSSSCSVSFSLKHTGGGRDEGMRSALFSSFLLFTFINLSLGNSGAFSFLFLF